jgi:hypothetical protein
MSGIIHLLNQTPIQWFCKKQNVVETATYGSEFMVARQATEQIMDLRYTLRMLGIPLDGPAWMFGDNQSVITSSTIPHSNLNKRHNALSYHRVREAISAQILYFIHIDGKLNPSDVMTKFLSWAKFWPLIQPFLFWKGETIKDALPNTPMPQIIAAIKDNKSPSGLRGVTRGNQGEPHGNNVSPSAEVNHKLNVNNVIKKKVSFTDFPALDRNVTSKSEGMDRKYDDPTFGISQHNPQPTIISDSAVSKGLLPELASAGVSEKDWIVVTSTKSTGKLHKDVVYNKPTTELQQVAKSTTEQYTTSGGSSGSKIK